MKDYSRRSFLKEIFKLSTFPLISFAYSKSINMNNIKPAIQLYGLRNELNADLWGTLKLIADIGYKEIELYMNEENNLFFGYDANDFFKRIDDLGLKVIGQHILSGKYGANIRHSLTIGFEARIEILSKHEVPYLTHAWLYPQEREKIDDYYKLSELLNNCGEYSKKANIELLYHNHDFEFIKANDEIPYNILIKETDPEYVNFELDFYWMYAAGIDPIYYLNKFPDRFKLWHFKDMKPDSVDFTELGKGRIDFKEIMKYSKKIDVKHLIIDQDEFNVSTYRYLEENYIKLLELINN